MELGKRHIGREIKAAANLLDRRMQAVLHGAAGGATPMHGRIIEFLYDHREEGDFFQRDLEEFFSIRRSTASGILGLMERDGLLRRESVDYDARLKKLVLTEAGMKHHQRFSGYIAETEAQMSRGLTEEELDTFFCIMERIRKNLE